jgi:Protein of unknown function (DUF1059)
MAQESKHFHCKDVGYDCDWQLEGENEDAMFPAIEAHAAEGLWFVTVHPIRRWKWPHRARYRRYESCLRAV